MKHFRKSTILVNKNKRVTWDGRLGREGVGWEVG